MATEKTEVVIVGVGAAGGIIAAELAKAGMKVIGLERGPRLKTADFEGLDELRYFERQDLRPNIKREPVTWRPNANAHAAPMPVLNNGNQAGGGTVHYGTLSWRMHEDDFRVRSKTVERYGASAIPDDSSLVDWPVSYAELEPFYDKAEYDLGVSGKAGNLQGKKIDGGNVFEAPRSREYPMPALLVDQSGLLYEAGAKKLGLHPFPSPRAILSQPYKDRLACTYCGFCQSFGCYIGAKSSILVTKLPEADATGNFKLITGAMCHRVNSDNAGKVTGVSYYGPDRSDNTIEADIVIVAPFIYDNTRLMLLSKTDKFPNGLANSSGHLGKHIMAHMMANVFVTFDDRYVNNFMGPSAQKHTVTTSTPTTSITRGSASSAGRNCRSARRTSKAVQSPPRPWRRPPACRAGARASATSSPRPMRATAPWWRRPRTCRIRTRPSISIRTCVMPGACRRRASPTTGGGRTKRRASRSCRTSWSKSAAPWAARKSGRRRSARPARRVRIMRAAPAWALIRRIRSSTNTARPGITPICSWSAHRPSRPWARVSTRR